MTYDRVGGVDALRPSQSLHSRCDVHGLPEVVQPVVERHRQARALVQSDLQDQVVTIVRRVELAHGFVHGEGCAQAACRRGEGGHHRIAYRLDDGALVLADHARKRSEMMPHQVVCHEIPHPFVQLGGAAQVGEENGQAGDLEALIHGERIRLVQVTKRLIAQHVLGSEEGSALGHQVVQLVVRPENARQKPSVAAILERQAQWARSKLEGVVIAEALRVGHGQLLTLVRGLSLHVEKVARVRDRFEQNQEFRGQRERQDGAFAGRERRVFHHQTPHHRVPLLVARQGQPRAEIKKMNVVPVVELARVVMRQTLHARIDTEHDFHQLVERWFVGGGAKRAWVLGLFEHLQVGGCIQNSAATGTDDVPVHVEQAHARGVQERLDDLVSG